MRVLLVLILCSRLVDAQAAINPNNKVNPNKKMWVASVVSVFAATGFDAYSSWGGLESNPALGRRFGCRSVGIKVGVSSAVMALEMWGRRKRNLKYGDVVTNLSSAGVFVGAGIRNERMRR